MFRRFCYLVVCVVLVGCRAPMAMNNLLGVALEGIQAAKSNQQTMADLVNSAYQEQVEATWEAFETDLAAATQPSDRMIMVKAVRLQLKAAAMLMEKLRLDQETATDNLEATEEAIKHARRLADLMERMSSEARLTYETVKAKLGGK